MKVLNSEQLLVVSGGVDHGELAAGAVGQFIGGTVGSEFGPLGTRVGQAAGAFVGKEIYTGIRDGYKTAPGISSGLGGFNPNYNPGLISGGFGHPPAGVTLPWCMMGNKDRPGCN
ncbi:hypothetical protein G3G77_004725 [Salmonella enterica]|uniref:hypothetical protein n=1 Tax=Hafnia sp. HMSC23F03 TaxID=1581059 RepID=UPI0008A53AAF|nr:hypothetical protein [Hafnia sp. HMSC23F03]EEG5674657.1 hypothetical protein [Salmonella enterica]EEH5466498.1 hypothetical protein [Salmonella enterica]EEH7555983.1 hypothetical protein [Salmonella enterica]EEO5640134.1 hypothetical protein [Salmonella enterica]EEQ0204243.1 hypothetical protein [Salmonella enterica]